MTLSQRTDQADAAIQGAVVRRLPDAVLLAALALSLLLCGGLLIYGSGRGLDLTDEIFYLIWTRDPNAYALIYQPFGYLLHPLFGLAGGNLQIYRLAGFAIAAGAGGLLGLSLSPARESRAAFPLFGSVAALAIFYPWIITPSYNSAANVGAMLIAAAILNASAGRPGGRIAGALVGGLGLCIAAFSKPPLFAIAVVAMLATALFARRRGATLPLLAALALAAIMICLLLPPTEIAPLIARIVSSQHVLALPNTPLALPGKLIRDWNLVPLSLTGATVAACLGLALRRYPWARWAGHAAVALSFVYVANVAAEAIDGGLPDFIGLALVTAAAGYAGMLPRGSGANLPAILMLLAAPLAVALGTFNNQWFQLNFSMAFPLLAIFALAAADPMRWRAAIFHALCVAGSVILLLLAALYPYSLPDSIFAQQIRIDPPLAQGPILVDEETATFVRSAHGLASGSLLIDLSGTGPGVAAILGAHAPVLPWLNPATEAWPDIVWSRLTPEQRERAWFVGPVWPSFERSSPALWLAAHKTDYCARTMAPMTFWDHQRTLQVWRPCRGSTPPR